MSPDRATPVTPEPGARHGWGRVFNQCAISNVVERRLNFGRDRKMGKAVPFG
jgi:hypothetical protein